MSVWDWIDEYRKRAQADGDKQRLRLTEIESEARPYSETDPDRMLKLFEEGRTLAERLNEPWWVLYFDHWRLWALLYCKRDFHDVHDLAIGIVLKVRSPAYAAYPGRYAIHYCLKSVYAGIDPVGYADEIRDLLDYIEREFAPVGDESRHLLNGRMHLAIECGQLEEAHNLALQELAVIDSQVPRDQQPSYVAYTSRCLAAIAHERSEWDALREWALLGQENARAAGRRLLEAEFLMWQAVLARRGRDEKGARLLKRQAISIVRRLRVPSDGPYWDALCAFYEVGGELELALRARQREFQSFAGRGLLGAECELLLKQCRLLSKLGRLGETDVARVRAAAARLRRPATYLAELERILQRTVGEE
jgi:hypothetical protein